MNIHSSFKQKIIFFGIIVFIVIATVIVGNFLENKKWREKLKIFNNNIPANNNLINANDNTGVESPTGVYLEQKEYKRGEKITGAVRNSGDFDIKIANIRIEKLSLSDCDASVGNVETKDCVQREWKTVKHNIGCKCGEAVKCEGTNIKAQAHNIYGFDWNQETDLVGSAPDSCKLAEPGAYRVKASYREVPNLPPGAISEAQIEQYIYSKEFIISDAYRAQSSD